MPHWLGRDVAGIERRGNLSRREFIERYLVPQRPVIVAGALESWGALRSFDHDYFRSKYGRCRVDVWEGRGIAQRTVEDFFLTVRQGDNATTRRPPYMEAFCLLHEHEELREKIGRLEFYPNWFDSLPVSLSTRLYQWKNLLLSVGGSVYPLHFDSLMVHACVAQLSGTKRIAMFPYDRAEALYDGRVDLDAPDFESFPRLRDLDGGIAGEFGPGDVAFIPAGFWHQVWTLTDSVSVVLHGLNQTNVRDYLRLFGARAAAGIAKSLTREVERRRGLDRARPVS